MKKLFTVGILALSSLMMAGTRTSTKSYEINLYCTTRVGNVQLKAGAYTLKVKGNDAVFTDELTAKTFTTPVSVVENETKFETTTVDAVNQGKDTVVVKDIGLGGSKTMLQFGE